MLVKAGIQEDLAEITLCKFQADLEESFTNVERSYEVLKKCVPYVVDFKRYQRRIESAVVCCKDMVTHLGHRICEIQVKEFDLDEEIKNLKELKNPYAASVCSDLTRTSLQVESRGDTMEATQQAEPAAKPARLRALQAQESAGVCLAELEAKNRKNLELEGAVEEQSRELELVQARQAVEEAGAIYRAISFLSNDGDSVRSGVECNERKSTLNPGAVSFASNGASRNQFSDKLITEASLARAPANAMGRNRFPVPTPSV